MVQNGSWRKAPIVAHLVDEGKVKVVSAYYDLDTGAVEFMRKA